MIACACADDMGPLLSTRCGGRCMVVIPATAGGAFSTAKLVIHLAFPRRTTMDSRFRGNDVEVVETPSNFFFNRTIA
jgi:hypothetical protein